MTFLVSALMHELIILHVDYRFGGKFLIFFFLHAMGVIGEQLIPNRLKSRIHKSFSQYAWSYCLCRVLQFLYVFIFTYGTAELYFIGPVFGIRLPEWLYESLMYIEENINSFSLFTRQGLQISKSELRIWLQKNLVIYQNVLSIHCIVTRLEVFLVYYHTSSLKCKFCNRSNWTPYESQLLYQFCSSGYSLKIRHDWVPRGWRTIAFCFLNSPQTSLKARPRC